MDQSLPEVGLRSRQEAARPEDRRSHHPEERRGDRQEEDLRSNPEEDRPSAGRHNPHPVVDSPRPEVRNRLPGRPLRSSSDPPSWAGSIAHVSEMKKPSLPPPQPSRPRDVSRALGLAAFGALILSGLVRCPFATIMHVPCPGCGSTRAVRAVLSLDFATAMRFNPMAPVITLAVAVLAVDGILRILRDGQARDLAMQGPSAWAVRTLAVCVVLELPIWALRFFGLFGGPVPV